MSVISFTQSYNPTLDFGDDLIAEFDGEADMSLITRTGVTKYPVEEGFDIAGSLVLQGAEIVFTWAVGLRKVAPLLSTDFNDNLTTNAPGLLGGFASNFIDSGTLSFLIGALANSSIAQSDENSRAFNAMRILDTARMTGTLVNPIIEGLGIMRNMAVTQINATRGMKDGGKVTFKITLSQILQNASNQNAIQKENNLGNIKGEEVEL